MSKSALEWALQIAGYGFLIGPLPAGQKAGQKVGWQARLTTDPDKIRAWFDLAPEMNYMVCAPEKGAILDLDNKEAGDGRAVFIELQMDNTEAPTFAVSTPNKGEHHYYLTDHQCGNGHRFPKGLADVRGGGGNRSGYVVGPGCTFEGKEYKVEDDQTPKRAPDWLQEYFKPSMERQEGAETPLFELDLPTAIERTKALLAHREPAIEGSGGDDHTFVTFVKIKDFCISMDKAIELVMEEGGWNDRCDPPWNLEEITVKAENAYRFGKNAPGAKGGVMMDIYKPEDVMDINNFDFEEEMEEDFSEEGDARSVATLLKNIHSTPAVWDDIEPVKFFIAELVPDTGYTALLAARNVGKSTIMTDIACRTVFDMDWHGWPMEEGYHVIYFCGEHLDVGLSMFASWKMYNDNLDPFSTGRLHFVDMMVNLMEPQEVTEWCRALRENVTGKDTKVLVCLDTWQRATSTASQSDEVEMQIATQNAERISKELNGPIICAFHPPRHAEDQLFGSSVLDNNSKTILHLTKETGDTRMLSVTRMKGMGEGNYHQFDFRQFSMEKEDQFGRDITGHIPLHIGGTSPNKAVDKEKSKAETSASKLDETRQALGRFFAVYIEVARTDDPKADIALKVKDAAKLLVRIATTPESKMTDSQRLMYAAGGDVLFDKCTLVGARTNDINACFVKPLNAVVIAREGYDEDIEIGFKSGPGRTHVLYSQEAYKGS